MNFKTFTDNIVNFSTLESISSLGFLPFSASVITDSVLSRHSLCYRFRALHIAVPLLGYSPDKEQNDTRFSSQLTPLLYLQPPQCKLSDIDNNASLLIIVRNNRNIDGLVMRVSADNPSDSVLFENIHRSFVSISFEERVLQLDCHVQTSCPSTALFSVRLQTACNVYKFVYDESALITSAAQTERSRVISCWRLDAFLCSISSTTLSSELFLPVYLKWLPGTEQLAILTADHFIFSFDIASTSNSKLSRNRFRLVSQTQLIPPTVDRQRPAWFALIPLTACSFVLANRQRVVLVHVDDADPSAPPVVQTLFQLESAEELSDTDDCEEIRCIEAFQTGRSLLVATTTQLLVISSERPNCVRYRAAHQLLAPPVCLRHLESLAPFDAAAPSQFPSGDVVLVAGGSEAHLFHLQRVAPHVLLPTAPDEAVFIRQVAPVLRAAPAAALLELWRDEAAIVTCSALRARLESALCGGALVSVAAGGGFVLLWRTAAGDLFWQPFAGVEVGFAGCTPSGSQPANCVPLRWHEDAAASGESGETAAPSSRSHTPSRALLELPGDMRTRVRDWLIARAHSTRPPERSLLIFGREWPRPLRDRASDELNSSVSVFASDSVYASPSASRRKRKIVVAGAGSRKAATRDFVAVAAALHEAVAASIDAPLDELTDCAHCSHCDPLTPPFTEPITAAIADGDETTSNTHTIEDRIIHILTNE